MSTEGTAEFDAFMAKVDLVHDAVKGLADGSTSVHQSQHLLSKLQPPPPKPVEEQKEQLSAAARAGAGVGDGYSWWCGQCRLEYDDAAVRGCERCGGSLTSKEQRHAFLKQKVQRLSEEKQLRRERRERFKALKLARQLDSNSPSPSLSAPTPSSATSNTATSSPLLLPHSAWDDYEPSSSSDSDSSLAAHNPAFAALDADLSARQRRRQLDADAAEAHKADGNRAFTARQYEEAAQRYTAAIDKRRGEKVYYANRAACWLKLARWEECVKDCGTVLDIWELIERGEEKSRQRGRTGQLSTHEAVVIKALLRRCEAWKATKEWDKARADLERAAAMEPALGSKPYDDIQRLSKELQEQQSEQLKEDEARTAEGRGRDTVANMLAGMRGGAQLQLSAVVAARRLFEADDKWRVVLRNERGVEAALRWLGGRLQGASLERDELVAAVLDMLCAAAQNERNKDEVVAWKGVELLASIVDNVASSVIRQQSAWRLLATLGERSQCRRYMLLKQPDLLHSALKALATSALFLPQLVLSLLSHLALDHEWKTRMLSESQAVLSVLLPLWNSRLPSLLSPLASLLADLASVPGWRTLLASQPRLLAGIGAACSEVFDRSDTPADVSAQTSVLSLALQFTGDGGAVLSTTLSHIRPSLPHLIAALRSDPPPSLQCSLLALLTRAAGAAELRQQLVEQHAVEAALATLERGVAQGEHTKPSQHTGQHDLGVEILKQASRLVAACAPHPSAASLLTACLPTLAALLDAPSPILAGNVALALSLLALQPALHEQLSACVVGLLGLMRRCSGRSGQGEAEAANNAAIACARLAKHGENMMVIRAHGGMALIAAAGKKSLQI